MTFFLNLSRRLSLSSACLVATFACLFYVFFDAGKNLLGEWSLDEYSHGYLIPPLAALMAWHRLAGKKIEASSSFWGVAWIATALIVLIVSELSTFRQLSYYAIVLAVVGMTLLSLGAQDSRKIVPAFVLLAFAMPLPTMLYATLSLNMKLISSTLGVAMLHLIGVPVFQDGNIIDLGAYKLEIADACNGLRYLFPVASLAYLIAYLAKDKTWKKIVVFLSFTPITIAMNAFRIAFIGITVSIWGIKAAEGFVHFFEGFVVFFFCVLLLLAETLLLLRLKPRGSFGWDFFALPSERLHITITLKPKALCAAFGISFAAAALFASGGLDRDAMIKPPAPGIASFPLSVGEWTGARENLEPYVLKQLDLTDYWLATYMRSNENLPINFYIAYYSSQKIGTAVHSPTTCLPGGGWKVVTSDEITWTPPQATQDPLRIQRLVAALGDRKTVVYYWFSERGRNITTQFGAKWYLMIDSLLMNRSDGALVRLVSQVEKGETEAQTEARMRDFLGTFYENILTALPR